MIIESNAGNEPMLIECDQRKQPYLCRLRQTAKVNQMLARLFNRSDWSAAHALSQGWQATEDQIKLSGLTKKRRAVVLSRRIQQDVALTSKELAGGEQLTLGKRRFNRRLLPTKLCAHPL